MNGIVLRIDGSPKGKARARFNRESGRAYTPSATVHAEGLIKGAWLEAGRPRIDGPVALCVTLVLERPKGHYRRDGSLSAAGVRTPWPSRKPDVDNALKLVADSLNRLAYQDDALIAHAWVVKRWAGPGEFEHTLIEIAPMPDPAGAREAA